MRLNLSPHWTNSPKFLILNWDSMLKSQRLSGSFFKVSMKLFEPGDISVVVERKYPERTCLNLADHPYLIGVLIVACSERFTSNTQFWLKLLRKRPGLPL